MKWSIRVGAISGIGIYLHATFLIFLGWVAMMYWLQEQSFTYMIYGVAFLVLLFLCVLLHELGHALVAKKYGIKTRDITLLPIGGVARLEKMPDDPRQELWVALAGPAVNVIIAAVLIAWLLVSRTTGDLTEMGFTTGSLLARLIFVNLFLVAFNMLPAFPMDGGRVLRALLALRMPYDKATQIAATIGQAMAFAFGFIGLFTNPFLIFIGFFVWIGAAQEASLTHVRTTLGGIPVSHAMITEFHTLSSRDTLDQVVKLLLAGTQQDFPVVDEGRVVGILTRTDLLKGLAHGDHGKAVGEVMQRDFKTVDAYEMLDAVFNKLQACACRILPVMRQGRLLGLVTPENLGEFLMVQSALSKAGGTDLMANSLLHT